MEFNVIFQESEIDSRSLQQAQQHHESLHQEYQQQHQLQNPDVTGHVDAIAFGQEDSYNSHYYEQQVQQPVPQYADTSSSQDREAHLSYAYYAPTGSSETMIQNHSSDPRFQQAERQHHTPACGLEYPTFTELMPAPSCQQNAGDDQSMM